MNSPWSVPGPHNGAKVITGGVPLVDARGALILVHGRGATAEGMLDLAEHFEADAFAWFAPQANGHTWYPHSFLAPLLQNQPHLDSALALLEAVSAEIVTQGIPTTRQVLVGFSQGACLALEFAARSDRGWGGVAGLSGGVIGPPGTMWDRPAGIAGTPVFLGCSDVDPHIPVERVHETRDLFRQLGADIEEQIYPGMPHTINDHEIVKVRRLLDRVPR